jgi:putative CRISPR-associated protein (TIGR02620 family)
MAQNCPPQSTHTPPQETYTMETIIVTRHSGTISWLRSQGIVGDVLSHVTDAAQIAGKRVIGALPLHLAVHAAAVGSIDMPALRAEQRGQDLTPPEMDAAGASIRWYVVATETQWAAVAEAARELPWFAFAGQPADKASAAAAALQQRGEWE